MNLIVNKTYRKTLPSISKHNLLPGKFQNIKVHGDTERIPITIS